MHHAVTGPTASRTALARQGLITPKPAPLAARLPNGKRQHGCRSPRPLAIDRLFQRKCRLPVSRILSTPVLPGAGRSFLSPRLRGTPRLRGVRLIPGNERAGRPFPVMSCTTRGFHCRSGCPRRGGLLPHHFNLTCARRGFPHPSHRRCIFCCTFRPLAFRFASPAFTRRVALRCPDFPQQVACAPIATARETAGGVKAEIPKAEKLKMERLACRAWNPRGGKSPLGSPSSC